MGSNSSALFFAASLNFGVVSLPLVITVEVLGLVCYNWYNLLSATAGMVRLVQPVRVLSLESLVQTVEGLFLLSSCPGTIDAM